MIYSKRNKLYAFNGTELNKHDALALNDGIHRVYMNRLHKERTFKLNVHSIDKNNQYLENQKKRTDEILKLKERDFDAKYELLALELRKGKGYADPDEVRQLYNSRNFGQRFLDQIELIENENPPNYHD